jgi:hypothetical protein
LFFLCFFLLFCVCLFFIVLFWMPWCNHFLKFLWCFVLELKPKTELHIYYRRPMKFKINKKKQKNCVRAVWSGSMLFAISFSTCNRVGKRIVYGSWSDCATAQAGLDPCWSQTHYVGFVVTMLQWNVNDISSILVSSICLIIYFFLLGFLFCLLTNI